MSHLGQSDPLRAQIWSSWFGKANREKKWFDCVSLSLAEEKIFQRHKKTIKINKIKHKYIKTVNSDISIHYDYLITLIRNI